MYFDSINDLITAYVSVAPTNGEYIVAGYFAPGDGGGGTFVWVPDTTPLGDDGGIIFRTPPGSSGEFQGYFKRLYSGPINVRWFGAKGDGIADDTAAVHAARDSEFATYGGTIYFPKGEYVGEFQMYNTSIVGDGYQSVLKAKTTSNRVLALGGDFEDWEYKRVDNIKIDGVNYTCDGVYFYDNRPAAKSQYAGRWLIDKVRISRCNIAIHKPEGNIGNTFSQCIIEKSVYGYYCQSYNIGTDSMQSGADTFIGGHISGCSAAAICIKSVGGYGQCIIDGTVIEGNPGMGIFVKLTDQARMTFCAIEIRNAWLEQNCGYKDIITCAWVKEPNVTIDGIVYANCNYRFEGVRSVSITGSRVRSLHLVDSSVVLYNCRSDDAYGIPTDDDGKIEVDSTSSLVATELRNITPVSENIFVSSISYDGTTDIEGDISTLTSVWGPLRNTLVKKVYETLPYNVKYGSLLDGTSPISFGVVNSVQVAGGVLGTTCAKLFIPPSTTASLNCGFSLAANKYYMWSIHALQDTDNISGMLHTQNSNVALGQVILKKQQWACAYGIKKYNTGTTDTVYLSLTNNSSTDDGILYLADVQVVEFSNYADAVSFAQSRAFISIVRSIVGPTHTTSLANVYVRWDAAESSFAIENDFNIAGIERVDVGVYDLSFVLPLENTPIVQLTPELLKTDEGNDNAVVASFENLSVDGVRVRLQQLVEGTPLPVDCSYSFSVQ